MNKELADQACTVMNEAFALDPDAIRMLTCQMVKANQGIADHPTIVVGQAPCKWTLSPLGLINGIVDQLSGYRIAANWSDTKNEDGSYTFLGFVVVEKK